MNAQIKGRVTGKIEITTTPTGKQVTNLRIAENKAYIDRKGIKRRITNWFTLSVWNGLAASLKSNVRKGDLVEFNVSVKPESYLNEEKQAVVNKLVYTAQDFRLVRRAGYTHDEYQRAVSDHQAAQAQQREAATATV